MTILHLANGRLFGGIEQALIAFARSSGAHGIRSRFAVCSEARLTAALRSTGAECSLLGEVRLRRPGTILTARSRLHRILSEGRADVIACHAPWAHALFASVVRRRRIPLVLWLHDAPSSGSIVDRWARSNPADLVVANSRWTGRRASSVQPGVPVEIVPCPVLPARTGVDRGAVRESLSTPLDHVVVLMASRMESWKGHRTLLRALADLRDLRQPWTAWIAGGAQRPAERRYFDQLRRLAAAFGLGGRIRLLGQRADVPDLMAAADIFCQPNEAPEPFGVVFVEALAAGLPVVTTAGGGAPEIVDDRCGRLVAPGDTAALARVLRELMEEPELRRRLAAVALQRVARYEPSSVLPRLLRAMERLHAGAAA